MDRDIEQAADFPCCAPPAGRGDATQPNPAMIKRAVSAARLAVAGHEVAECDCDRILAAIEAAAAVIVPATAEQIAAAIAAVAWQLPNNDENADGLWDAAEIARGFAAAGAGPGEGSDE